MPEQYENTIRQGIKNFDFKTLAGNAIEMVLKTTLKSMGMQTSTFNSLKDIGQAIKNSDIKKALSGVLDIGVNSLKGVPTTVKSFLKSSKNLILENIFEDELKKVMTKQKNTISRLNKKCSSFEEALNKQDMKEMDKLAKSIKTDLDKVIPIRDVILKSNETLNIYNLIKNKGSYELTNEELELCKKLI